MAVPPHSIYFNTAGCLLRISFLWSFLKGMKTTDEDRKSLEDMFNPSIVKDIKSFGILISKEDIVNIIVS
jgi:hypothetical protein